MDAHRRPSHHALIRAITAAETRPLRHRVLRPTQAAESTLYPGDDQASVHLGAFEGDRLVGVASLYAEPRTGAAGGWRLRGMATAPEVRGRGLAASVSHAAGQGGGELWCNARLAAVGFYAARGFEVVSDEFDVPDIGPHVVMATTVPARV